MERQRPDIGAVLPQVLALREALLVQGLVGEVPRVVPAAAGDPLVHGRAESLQLPGGQEVGHHHEPVTPEVLDQARRERGDGGHPAGSSPSPRTSRM